MLRKGDCSSCTESPCRSVPSKTASPVVFVKSASTMVSLSVSACACVEKEQLPAASATTNAAAPGTITSRAFGWASHDRCGRCWLVPGPNLSRASAAANPCEFPPRSGIAASGLSPAPCSRFLLASAGFGLQLHGATGARFRIASWITPAVLPRKGRSPVAIS